MACRHAIGIQVARGFQKIFELDTLVAADAGHRSGAGQITVGELVNHRIAKDVLVIQHVVGKAHFLGHAAGIVNVDPGTAGAFLGQSRAVVIKLQGDPHDIITFLGQHRGHNRRIHAARHRHDNARVGRGLGKPKGIEAVVQCHDRSPGTGAAEYRKILDTLKPRFHPPLSLWRKTWPAKAEG